ASGNEMLIEILDILNTKTARFLQSIEYVIDDFDWFYNSLKGIADAISKRDSDKARVESQRHITNYVDQMSKRFFGFN
ncbi:MAG: FCD domain-containing protein, partial [Proteobacteria bacterium]|nr:FCD domain-containing protein [Pseudomonadota bacterium]